MNGIDVALGSDLRALDGENLLGRHVLAETIMNVFGDESVSAIFAGENQLF